MNWKLIFNPFGIYSEKQLFVTGILLTLTGALLGSFLDVTYDGVLDIHQSETDFLTSLKENGINVACIFVTLLIAGKIINRKTRAIDIFNTATISRFPMYIGAVITSSPILTRIGDQILNQRNDIQHLQLKPLDLALLLVISFVLLMITVYYITLLVNGFKTSVNAKKWQHFAGFAVALLIAEIISKILINI
ncbi:hypothetical protein [Chryseobacterium sp. SL1]|uniref:hypothetical protein n=1 Tax=Chryseobacterium sp. SL1 TaxID=2995159 RepID=UPI002275F274|nr:hypothetical protein [Chryseobacterium sp. SL1]MCY1662947.1 hypothetical protein [Chryseobacterium sp. SL1]